MPIPEAQLDTWSKIAPRKTAKKTRDSIRKTIYESTYLAGRGKSVYLQGSYGNSTNIYGKSDVDLVAELTSTYFYNIDQLSEREKKLFRKSLNGASYSLNEFRNDVIDSLRDKYGDAVDESHSRCIKVEEGSNRQPADVLVCQQYRIYTRYESPNDCDITYGVKFQDQGNGQWIVNFPKQHRDNGSDKNSLSRTSQKYKPTVRMLKNAREKLINDGYIDSKLAPSYFVECLLYNVPDPCFSGTYREKFSQVLEWLEEQISDDALNDFCCQNEQGKLFGYSFVQWRDYKATTFVQQLRDLWDDW